MPSIELANPPKPAETPPKRRDPAQVPPYAEMAGRGWIPAFAGMTEGALMDSHLRGNDGDPGGMTEGVRESSGSEGTQRSPSLQESGEGERPKPTPRRPSPCP